MGKHDKLPFVTIAFLTIDVRDTHHASRWTVFNDEGSRERSVIDYYWTLGDVFCDCNRGTIEFNFMFVN